MKSNKVCLTSKRTGEKYYFDKQLDADKFLGHAVGYSHNMTMQGCPVKSSVGEEFLLEVIGKATHEWHGKEKIYKAQLCTTCARAYGLCSWSKDFEPVDGWKAERTFDVDGKEFSYKIEECPLYEEDAKTAKKRKEQYKRLKVEFYGSQMDKA